MGARSQSRKKQTNMSSKHFGLRQAKKNADCTCHVNRSTCHALFATDASKTCRQCTQGASYHKGHAEWCPRFLGAGKTHAEYERIKEAKRLDAVARPKKSERHEPVTASGLHTLFGFGRATAAAAASARPDTVPTQSGAEAGAGAASSPASAPASEPSSITTAVSTVAAAVSAHFSA